MTTLKVCNKCKRTTSDHNGYPVKYGFMCRWCYTEWKRAKAHASPEGAAARIITRIKSGESVQALPFKFV